MGTQRNKCEVCIKMVFDSWSLKLCILHIKTELASAPKADIMQASCDGKSCDHQNTVIILRSAMLQLALSNLREAQA